MYVDDGITASDDDVMRWDKDRVCRHHWEKCLHYKAMWECHKKMHDHCMMMMDYHYKMCMHYLHGHPKPPIPMMEAPAAMPFMPTTPGVPTRPEDNMQ